jgi:predicted secreted protein
MGIVKGKEGTIQVGATATALIAELRSWELQETANEVDVSRMGDDWTRTESTQLSWSGSLEAFWDAADTDGQGAISVGEYAELHLFPAGGTGGTPAQMTGSALITEITYKAAHDGIVEASISFTGNGTLTKTNM